MNSQDPTTGVCGVPKSCQVVCLPGQQQVRSLAALQTQEHGESSLPLFLLPSIMQAPMQPSHPY